MPVNDVSIHIEAEDRSRQAFRSAEQSLDSLERQTRELQGTTRATAAALGLSGNAAQEAGTSFTSLGRQIFNTQEEAKRAGGVFRSLDGRLREANGRFVKGREAVQDWTQAAGGATRSTGILTRSVGSLGGALSALAIGAVVHQIGQLGINSVQAAGQMEQLRRATEQIQGSSAAAEMRISQLIEVANLPGLNFEPLVRYANQFATLGLSAEDTDKILLGVGQTVVSLGGTAASAELSIIQLLQAFRAGTIDMRDFRTIIQQIPGILNAAADVHGVEANIEGLREAFEKTGGSMRDLLIPTFDELSRRFEAPPADSYIVAMDTLQNAFFLTQSAVGDLFLPVIVEAAQGLSNFLETVRAGIKDVSLLPEPIQDIVVGAKDLYEGLLSIASAIESSVGPEVRELLPALATLLGGVLELAGAIANVLSPAYQVLSKTTAVVVALVTKLAQDITSMIGILTDFVDWVSRAWREEDKFTESTQRVTEAIENVEKATSSATQSTQEYQGSLLTILRELQSVNTELEEKRAKLEELKEKGLTPADASMAQIVRRIALLEERSKSLTGSLPNLSSALEGVNEQLADKNKRLTELRDEGEGASASAEQLQRQIANLTALAALLNVQIALTPPALSETSEGMNTATVAVENYSLTLARLKAEAEDARDTLSNTINFEQIGENYRAAIAASDAYYNKQIANAQAALSQAEADSEEYQKIETDIFNLQRQRQEARKKITAEASAVARTEAEKRIEIANEEKERLQQVGEETARALAASQKQQADAAEAEQKRLTQIHQENLKQREEAERASNERVVKDSEERLSILSNAFENALPAGVDTAYENIQKATVAHYETLKNQARQRITDEDALNVELVSLDRQRNAALEDNHRGYLQRIASDAKDLLGERTDAFTSASDDILHNWERTVSDFERQLREADTEDAIRAIEADFASGQKNMLASLESVLTELGFTADETAEIMKEIFRTAEGESDSFADKVISAFKRLGKEADRETKQQNRQIERNYRELVGEIEHILSNITDFFIEITRGGDIEDAFKQLGERVAGSFLDIFTREISENFAASLTNLATETDIAGAAASRGGGAAGAGGAIQAAGGLTSVLSLITSPIALAAIIPAAVGAATYYIGRQVAGSGTDEPVNRQGRPIREDPFSRRRRGESQAAYESRLRERSEAEAAIAERETFFGNYDPRAPFGRAIQESGIFTGDTGYFAESVVRQTEVDPFGRVDLPSLFEDLEGILQTRVEGLGEDMQRAASALESASGADLKPALSEYFSATTDFYQTQIDFANFVRRTTGHLDFGDVEGLSRQLQESLNQARLQDTSTNLTLFGIQRNRREAQALAERTGTDRQFTEDIARAQYGDEAYDAEVAGLTTDPTLDIAVEDTVDPELLSRLNISNLQTATDAAIDTFTEAINAPRRTIESINEAFTALEPDLRTLYDALYEGIAGEDGIINTAEEQIEFNRLGTFEEFTQRYRDLRDTAIDVTKQTQQRFATLSQQIATNDVLKTFSESARAPGTTIADITREWETTVLPQINALYDQLFNDIAGADGFINTPEEQIAFLELGSREDFIAGFETDIRDPAIDKMNNISQALASIGRDRELTATFETFNEAAIAPGATVSGITQHWNEQVVPMLRETYNALRANIIGEDGVISAEEGLALAQAGLDVDFEDWVSQYENNVLTPAVANLNQTSQIIASVTQNRKLDAVFESFNAAIVAPGATIVSITTHWTEQVVPVLRETYDFLRAEIIGDDGLISPQEAAELTQAGLDIPFEDWAEGYENDILDPGITRLNSIAESLAVIHRDRRFDGLIEEFNAAAVAPGATVSGITAYWNERVVPVLRETYNTLRAEIIGEDGKISAEEKLALAQAGLDVDFEDWVGEYEDGILTPAVTALTEAAQIIASVTQNRELDAALQGFNSAVTAPGATVEGITTHWTQNVVPILRETYEFLRNEIIGEDGIISPAEAATLAQRGLDIPFEDWVGQYETDVLNPGSDKLNSIATSIATIHRDRRFEGLVEDFNAALQAPGQTVAAMTQWWTENMTPVLREMYDALRADIIGEDGIISPDELQRLTEAGLDVDFVDWESDFRDDILTPGLQRLATTNTNIGVALRATEQSAVIEGFNAAATAPGATIAGITSFWNANVSPVLRQTFEGLRNQIIGTDGIISPDELLQLIQAGLNVPFEDWESNFRDDLLAPATQRLSDAAEYLESTELQTNVDTLLETFKSAIEAPGATIASLTEQWNAVVVPALRALYQDLYDDIAGADGIVNTATERADLLQLGTEEDFVEGFATDVFRPLVGRLQNRQLQTRSALGQNAVSRAQFDLGNATSETDFEARRENLIAAVNAYYDAELDRINQLKLNEDELRDLREDNQLAREQALQQAETATNEFAQLRLRTEERLQDQIQDLREKTLETERDLADALVELEEEKQQKIADIRRKASQDREDVEREFTRDLQDILREAGADETLFTHGDFNLIRRIAQTPDQEALRNITSELGIELDDDALQDLREAAIERLRGLEDVGVRETRRIKDTQRDAAQAEASLNAQAQEELINLQQQTANLESQTAGVQSATASTQRQTASTASETAETDRRTAEVNAQTAETSMTTAENLRTVSEQFRDADFPQLFDLVKQSAESSIGITDAIQALPGAFQATLHDTFDGIINQLRETVIELTGIRGAINSDLLDTPGIGQILQNQEIAQPLTPPVLGTPQTELIELRPAPSALEIGGGSGGVVSVRVVGGNITVDNLGDQPVNVNSKTTLELDGDTVTEKVENNIVGRRAEGRSLLNG